MAWLLLAGAIGFEVFGTLSLRMLAGGQRRWLAGVLCGYLIAFTLLSLTLSAGMPLGMAYGIWTAVGVALTAVLGRIVFGEPLTWLMVAGIGLIGAGVLLVELGATH